MSAHFCLSAETTFSAAHVLPGVALCDRMHGHNWRVRLTVQFPEESLGPNAMGVDFRELEETAKESVSEFEHRYLNDLDEFREHPPTAEQIARVIYQKASPNVSQLNPAAKVSEVEVWETPAYRVSYRPE